MAPPKQGSTHQMSAYYSIYRPRKDERLSWPSWSTYSGRFIHISGHPSAAGQAHDRKVRRGITDVLPLCYATNHASTIGIEISSFPSLIFTGSQKMRNLAWFSTSLKVEPPAFEMQQDIQTLNQTSCVGMIALCLCHVW